MIYLRPAALVQAGTELGWVHRGGRYRGSLHVRRVARDLGVSAATVSRCYDGAPVSPTMVARFLAHTGAGFNDLFAVEDERRGVAS